MNLTFPFLALLCWPALGAAAEIVQEVGQARLSATASRQDGTLAMPFSDLLYLTVQVEGPHSLQVEPPATWTETPGWRTRAHKRASMAPAEKGRHVWQETFRLDPVAPGTHQVQLEPLRYRIGKGDWQTISWQPFFVKVTPTLTDPDRKNLREHVAIEELPVPSPPPAPWWPWVIAGAGLVAIGYFLARRRRSHARRSAEELANYELDRLAAWGLPAQGKHEEFHTLLANVVRRFLEKKHHLPARRRTTEEFLAELTQTSFSPEDKSFLEDFLQRCDLAKFAAAPASAEECLSLLARTRQFVQTSKTSGVA